MRDTEHQLQDYWSEMTSDLPEPSLETAQQESVGNATVRPFRERQPARHRPAWAVTIAAFAGVLLLGGVIWMLGLGWSPEDETPVATTPEPPATTNSAVVSTTDSVTTTIPPTASTGPQDTSAVFTIADPATIVQEIPIPPTTTIVPTPLDEGYWLYGDNEPGAVGGLIGDIAVADDGTVWAVVFDVDFQGPLLDGLVLDLELWSESWSLMRHDGIRWAVVTTSEGSPMPSYVVPRLLGVRPDGGVWFHDDPYGPEGPFFLWEYRDGAWIDHTDAAHLPGALDHGEVSMACCPMGIDATGAIWVGSEFYWGYTNQVLRDDREEGEWVSRFDGEWQAMAFTDGPYVGWFSIWMPPETFLADHVKEGWGDGGIERGGVRWTLLQERSEPEASEPRTWEYRDGLWVESGMWRTRSDSAAWERVASGMATEMFPVDIEELESNLGCNLTWGILDLETESVIAPDGALWTAWPCIGLTRVDPLDGSMLLFNEGAFQGVWRLAVAPDGTVYAAGTQGLVAFYPSADAGVPIGSG